MKPLAMTVQHRSRAYLSMAVILLLAGVPQSSSAGDLNCQGITSISFTGAAEEFTIPVSSPPAAVTIQIKGGDGGSATVERCSLTGCRLCTAFGGKAAEATATFRVGTAAGELEPGGTLRFIVGEAGESGFGTTFVSIGTQAGAGGGGSAVLYRPPGATGSSCADDWEVLVAAGGGGGAYQGVAPIAGCVDRNDGQDGLTTEDGSDGGGGGQAGDGGSSGNGGECGTAAIGTKSGGGGGAFTAGDGSCSRSGGAGCVAGGAGGQAPIEGGWGFGGGGGAAAGGGGGGGGGYSGGGGGGNAEEGGGGGSFVANAALLSSITVSPSNSPNGFATIRCDCAVDLPVNDECVDAIPLVLGSNSGCTEAATTSPDANLSCTSIVDDVWYVYTNPDDCSQRIELDWCQADFVTRLGMYWDCNDDEAACATTQCAAGITLTSGESVYLRLGGAPGAGNNSGEFQIQVTSIEQIGNDADGDGVPDGCDPCPSDNPDDSDQDGMCDSNDPCPFSSDDLCTPVLNFDCPYNLDAWIKSSILFGTTAITPQSGSPLSAQFSYEVDQPFGVGVSDRAAAFETVARSSGPWTFDYVYAGNHGSVGTLAQFYVAVLGPSGQTNYLVVNQSPVGAFSYSGTVSVPVNGDFAVGLVIGGGNDDPSNMMNGAITVSNVTWPDVDDADTDSVPDLCDVCSNGNDTIDSDLDSIPDDCDICSNGNDLVDGDGDGIPDDCDACPVDATNDSDGDTVCDSSDICAGFDDLLDADTDGIPDGCDICPGFDDAVDTDADGTPDGCDICPLDELDDSDGDGVCDSFDACPGFDDAIDANTDGIPDGCDCDEPPAPDAAVAVDDLIDFVAINSVDNTLDVLANDVDVAGEIITCIVDTPSNGFVEVINNRTQLRYTPDESYCNDAIPSAPDTFTYRLSGGSQATVSVVVACPYVLHQPSGFDTDGDLSNLTWYEARAYCRLVVGTDMAHSKCEMENPGGGSISPSNGNSCPDIPVCLPGDSPIRCGRRQVKEMMRVAQATRVDMWTGFRWFLRLCSPSGIGCQLDERLSWIDGTPLQFSVSNEPFRDFLSDFFLGELLIWQQCGFMNGAMGLGFLDCYCSGGANDTDACDGSVDSCPGGECNSMRLGGAPCGLCGCYSGGSQGAPCDEDSDCGNNGVCVEAGEYGVDCVGTLFGMLGHRACDGTELAIDYVLCDNPKLGFGVCGCDDPADCPEGFNSCDPGETCSSINICWPEGPGLEGDSCQFPNDCADGLSCDVRCTTQQECSNTDDDDWPIYDPWRFGEYTCKPTQPAQLGDSDNDGFHDQEEGCPLDPAKVTPGVCGCGVVDVDLDADGVCDSVDACLGFDDSMDADGDMVPDGCDGCPGFDDAIDVDTDGVPDACDRCAGFDDALDCDSNGIPDGCDLVHPGRFTDFDSTENEHFVLNQNANTTVVVSDGSVRLTEALQGQSGSIVFEPISVVPVESFVIEFDFFMGGGTGADGMSFVLIDANSTGTNILPGEGGAGQPLVVSLDTYRGNAAGGNHALLKTYGVTVADELVGHPLDDGQWQHAIFTFASGGGTLVLTGGSGIPSTVFENVAVPGYSAIHARYGFGARTGGATNEHRVDNVKFTITSQTNDCNTNGLPDRCDPDSDSDGSVDGCDLCPGADDRLDVDDDGTPDGCDPCAGGAASGDTDANGLIDGGDVTILGGCVAGPLTAAGVGCECFDFDADGDNDLVDFAIFQLLFVP